MHAAGPRPHRSRWRPSIAAYLTVGLGGLTFLAVASVLALTLLASFRNTSELLEDKSRLLLSSLSRSVRRYLDPAEAQVAFVARTIESGAMDPGDVTRLLDMLHAIVATSPQTRSVAFFDVREGLEYEARRDRDSVVRAMHRIEEDQRRALAAAAGRGDAASFWAPPVHLRDAGVTAVTLRHPVISHSDVLGMVVAAVDIRQLSAYVATLETEFGQNAFILYEHDHVLAHSILMTDFPGLGPERPLPHVDEIGDPVLGGMWQRGWEGRRLIAGDGHVGRVGGRDYVYLYTEIDDYGAPWLVGSYFAEQDVATQFQRFVGASIAGVAGLILAVVSAVLFGRAVRNPINRLAAAAEAVRGLDLERAPHLPRSRFRELDSAARAFNAMIAVLRAFALYVPRDLVTRLLVGRGDVAALPSETREVTIMFTDIVDFTARTERLGAEATATFLNVHFDLLTACIEAEGGTVDKFLGDGVMALWNAIEAQPDHAARAVRAAGRIADAVRQANAQRDPPTRLRIGIHSGPVVVGNIGSRSRTNYTVVGDPVNTAERLQTLGRELLPDADVAILLSDATRAALNADARLRSLGRHRLRGRDEPTEVFRADACPGP